MKHLFLILMAIVCSTTLMVAQTPAYRWARSVGGTGDEKELGFAVDASGNSYVTGFFSSSTLTVGSSTLTNAGVYAVLVIKYDPGGNVIWARGAGGISQDEGLGIASDASGNTYVTGFFQSSTISFGSTTLTNAGSSDIFIVKYDPSGNVVWAKSAGGTNADYGSGIGVDASGNVYVTGYFYSSTITFGSTTLTSAGSYDMFIVKYDANGNVVWAKRAGGSNIDMPYGIAVSASGNSYVTGYFASATITFGSTTLTNAGSYDMFIAKYDASGNVVWARGAGGVATDVGFSIAVDASGNSFVTGYFNSPTLTFGSTTLTNAGSVDMFVVKYDASGNVAWARNAGGAYDEYAFGIAIDTSGNSYVAGDFLSSTVAFGSILLTNAGSFDTFIVKYDAMGNVVWARSAGGSGTDDGYGIGVDASANCYVAGYFLNSTIPFGSARLMSAGGFDIFITKIDGNPPFLVNVMDVPNDQGGRVLLQWNAAAIDRVIENTTAYSVWRALPAGQMPPLAAPDEKASSNRMYRQFPLNGVTYYWEWIADQPPLMWPQYAYAAPTLSDSLSPTNLGKEYFVVVAQTSDPNVFYVSNVDSGYSVDNIPPVPPAGLAVELQSGSEVYLSWNSSADPDIGHYDIYRSTTNGFTPAPGLKIGSSPTNGYTDESPLNGSQAYYRIVAVDVHGNAGAPSSQVSVAITVTSSFSVLDRWNMISVPMTVSDYSKSALFPTALSQAFGYQGSYQIYATLQQGTGYWLKFTGAQSIPVTGFLLRQDTITVSSGWNLIGSLSSSIPVGNVGSIPGGMITSKFFGYTGSYQTSSTIEPGRGYWVKVNQGGKLVLSGSGNIPAAAKLRMEMENELPPNPPKGDGAFGNGMPLVYALDQNYPNPFNPSTVINYSIPASGHVKLSIYNTLGQEVMNVVDEYQDAGYKSISVNMSNLPSGIYTYRISAGTFTEVKKMALVR